MPSLRHPTRRAVLLGMAASIPTAALADVDDLAVLQAREWRISEIDGEPVAAEFPVTIAFDADGSFQGKACNGFRGSYTADERFLKLGQVAATRMACAEPGMTQENALFDAFARVTSFSVKRNGALWLLDEAGEHVVVAWPG